MDVRLFFTVTTVLGILYGLAFVFMPTQMSMLYGAPPEPHVALNAQFFGSALIEIAVVAWFARDFLDWDAIRGVLIAAIAGSAIGLVVNLVATFSGLLNAMAWTSTLVYAVILVWALYCLVTGPEANGIMTRSAR